MPYTLLLNLLQSKWTWIILLFLILIVSLYYVHLENQNLKLEKMELIQNSASLRDSIEKQADSIQMMAIKISSLNTNNEKLKKEYTALYSKYIISVGEIHDSGNAIIVLKDTSEISVSFNGERGIASYTGKTTYYPVVKRAIWNLSLYYKPIEVQSELLYDKSDSLWKIRTTSLTSDVKLISYSLLDQQLFKKLEGNKPITYIQKNIFGLGILGTSSKLSAGIIYNYNFLQIGMLYDIINNYKKSNIWYDKVNVSIHYFIL